jgi:tetratricopeptide (TPR) repeat protein
LYLGMNLGQVARTKLLGALGILDEMEAVWKKAIALDPKYDYAGAHRSLGLLYLDAPGWPTSIGSKSKARQHLEKAVELNPEYPGNRLCLLEAQLKWGETKTVRAQISPVEAVLKTARTNLTGEAWARDWQEWDERWQKIKIEAGVVSARSPKDDR